MGITDPQDNATAKAEERARPEEANWYCLYTKPRMEYRVHQALVTRGIESYLPELPLSARDRRRGIRRPFFPRYLFARMMLADNLLWVQWTVGLVRILSFGDSPVIVDNAIIEMLKENLAERIRMEAEYGQFRPGERVRVIEGPFRGFEAVFDRRLSGSGRVKILIEFLRRTTPYIVEASWITKTG